MDVLSIIKNEHHEVSELFAEADKCGPGDERLRELAREIRDKLLMHLAIEERLFYSRLKASAEDQDEKVDVFEAYTEHEAARSLIDMLKSARKPDEKFKAELQVLGESVKHHVKEEESTVFGIAREYLDEDERDRIGQAWEKAKARDASPATKKSAVRGTVAKATKARR